jgi:hypothetical protein
MVGRSGGRRAGGKKGGGGKDWVRGRAKESLAGLREAALRWYIHYSLPAFGTYHQTAASVFRVSVGSQKRLSLPPYVE